MSKIFASLRVEIPELYPASSPSHSRSGFSSSTSLLITGDEPNLSNPDDKEDQRMREMVWKLNMDICANRVSLEDFDREENCKIKEGEKYHVLRLLSSPSRDFLIKKNGEQVKIDQLSGKHVLFYFLCLSDDWCEPHKTNTTLRADLEEIYGVYNPQGKFEVVFIALGTNEKLFNDAFSLMPGLAIPHEDQEARDFLMKKFSIPSLALATPVLFDPDGVVLLRDSEASFHAFGPEGFPFTKQKTDNICDECNALWDDLITNKRKPSLTELLGETVISSEGNQVQTSELEDKIVGLYFFQISDVGFGRTRELLKIWKSLKESQTKDFEIVFINEWGDTPSSAKAAFKNEFGSTVPWYSLPVDGRKLRRVFKHNGFQLDDASVNAGYFIILEPDRYESLSYFALDILKEFGIGAYPFTLEKAVILAKSKQQKELVLDTLLSPSAPLHRGGSTCYKEDTTVSKITGKCVLLLFATHSCCEAGSFLPALKRMYYEKKGTDDEFEIIYISLDSDRTLSSFPRSIQGMPWLVNSFVPHFGVSLAEKVFTCRPCLPAIAAFGSNGHLETKESNLALKNEWSSKYPFIQADMDEEVRRELINRHKWDLERLFLPDFCLMD